MVKIKVKRDTYGGTQYLYNACHYVEDWERIVTIGGFGVDPYDLKKTFHQMMCVREYFGKVSGNPLMHFIVSFDECVHKDKGACILGDRIASYFKMDYQTLWCVHAKKRSYSRYHVHIVINSVSYINGKMYNSSRDVISEFCKYVMRVTGVECRYYFGGSASSDDA